MIIFDSQATAAIDTLRRHCSVRAPRLNRSRPVSQLHLDGMVRSRLITSS